LRSVKLHSGLAVVVLLFLPLAASAQATTLRPFKDELFAYPATLSSKDSGDYRVVDYSEARDINQRDEVPERQVKRAYVSLGVRSAQKDLKLNSSVGELRFYAVGRAEAASVITIYLHGQGGSRKQGVDDFTFGGNFNRIKNLMVGNGGLYLSPDFSDFDDKGAAEIAALIEHYAAASPDAKLFIACGSMGGYLCWKLAADQRIGQRLSGLLLLSSIFDETYRTTAAYKRKVPVFFGHGSKDKVFPVYGQEASYRTLRGAKGGYPARFVRFETGTHGTPIRMTDWRETLNWMLSVGG
jgi:predicted peptidase